MSKPETYETYKSFMYGPGQFPDCHQDILDSKYPATHTCNMLNKIRDSRAELDKQFTNDNFGMGMPALLISDDKRSEQNSKQYWFYMDQEPVIVNKPGCEEPFNVRTLNNATNLQKGYARNIDLDSELKRINHIADKCYYDSYKYNPDDAPPPNGLFCHREKLVKDYSAVGKPFCAIDNQPKSVITPATKQPKYDDPLYSSTNRVSYGEINGSDPSEIARDYTPCNSINMRLPVGKCFNRGIPQTFQQCDSGRGIDARAQQIIEWRAQQNKGQVPEYYRFNGDTSNPYKAYNANFPCQRLFNNNTKRSNLPNLFNTFDPNPRYLV